MSEKKKKLEINDGEDKLLRPKYLITPPPPPADSMLRPLMLGDKSGQHAATQDSGQLSCKMIRF